MPAIKAIIGADSSQMQSELRIVDKMAKQTGQNIQAGLSGGGHSGQSGIIRETIVLMREISRGNWSRVPGSLSILLQKIGILNTLFKDNSAVARAAAQTIADGLTKAANESEKFAVAAGEELARREAVTASIGFQTEAQLLQSQANREAVAGLIAKAEADRVAAIAATENAAAIQSEGLAMRLLLSPVTWIAAGLIAGGVAAYFLIKHFRALATETKNLKELLDTSNSTFTDQAAAIKNAADEAQSFADWLDKLSDKQTGLGEQTDIAIKALREQSRVEREIAKQHGAGNRELAQMDIDAAKKELDLVEKAKLQAGRKVEDDKSAAQTANDELVGFDKGSDAKGVSRHAEQAAKIADAIQDEIKNKRILEIDPIASRQSAVAGGTGAVYKSRAANADDIVDIKVDGKEFSMSLNQATKIFNDLAAEEADLTATQKALKDLAESKKTLTEKDIVDQKKLSDHAQELKDKIKADTDALPGMIDKIKPEHHSMGHGHLSNLQQVGAFTTGAVDIAHKSLKVQEKIEVNTRGLGNGFGKTKY